MPRFPFIGGSYVHASSNASAARSLNLYPEALPPDASNGMCLVGTPGLLALGAALPTSPIRGLWAGENRLFVVSGSKLYEVNSSGAPINGLGGNPDRGDVGNDSLPAQIFPNGNQLMIISNGLVWIDTGTSLVQPTYPGLSGTCNTNFGIVTNVSGNPFDASMVGKTITITAVAYTVSYVSDPGAVPNFCLISTSAGTQTGAVWTTAGAVITGSAGAFLDGYFIAAQPTSKQFSISGINNGLSWDGLDYAIKEGYPDNIRAIIADHEELYLCGSDTSEVFRNTGAAGFPLERDPGAVMALGITAKDSLCRLATGIAMLGGDSRGHTVAYHIQGYQPVRVSTAAHEKIWKSYSTVADAISYAYVENGHHFWVLCFPAGDATFVYDATEKLWHDRTTLSGGIEHMHRAAFHAYVFGKHIVGAYASGQLYTMSTEILDDAGTAITRQRTAPHLSADGKRTFFSMFQLDCEANAGTTPLPVFTLDWSIDKGHTYLPAAHSKGAGWITSYLARILWNRLGSGFDRVFRVTSVAKIRHVWVNGYYRTPDA